MTSLRHIAVLLMVCAAASAISHTKRESGANQEKSPAFEKRDVSGLLEFLNIAKRDINAFTADQVNAFRNKRSGAEEAFVPLSERSIKSLIAKIKSKVKSFISKMKSAFAKLKPKSG